MAPKRKPVRKVVMAKKVVEETFEVVITPEGNENVVSSSTKANNDIKVLTTPLETTEQNDDAEVIDNDETQPASEPQTIPEPPPKPSVETPRQTETKVVKSETAKRAVKSETEKKAVKSVHAAKKSEGGAKKRRKRGAVAGEGGEGYKRYVYKVMKQVHPDLGISGKAMTVINNYMSDMFERLADEGAKLLKYTGKHTLSSREVQGAVKLVLPGELGKHAIAEGTKAVTNYVNYGQK